jgi:hypothetical protein
MCIFHSALDDRWSMCLRLKSDRGATRQASQMCMRSRLRTQTCAQAQLTSGFQIQQNSLTTTTTSYRLLRLESRLYLDCTGKCADLALWRSCSCISTPPCMSDQCKSGRGQAIRRLSLPNTASLPLCDHADRCRPSRLAHSRI